MKVNSNRDISFKNVYTNRALKQGLEFAADNGSLFAATATVAYSLIARPAAIWLTPDTEKENRKFALAKSISSSFTGFILMLLVSRPIAKSINAIDKNPSKYISKTVIDKFKQENSEIYNSKSYIFSTQLFKLGIGLLAAAPKAILTAIGVPLVMKGLFENKDTSKNNNRNSNISFKGKGEERLAKQIGKAISNKSMQNITDKYKDSNFVMHIIALTDAITTAVFIHQTKNSKSIKDERKNALMCNAGISTVLSIASSYIIDKLLDKPVQKFIDKYKSINKSDININKQIQGIRVAKPILILGTVYYMIIPFISTYLAEIIDKKGFLNEN